MSDLVEWLTKILDEDEATARASQEVMRRNGYSAQLKTRELIDQMPAAEQKHIYRWIAPHVLADIAAKRAILEQREQITVDIGEANADRRRQMNLPILVNIALALDTTIQHLASAYADRPGYDESWRP